MGHGLPWVDGGERREGHGLPWVDGGVCERGMGGGDGGGVDEVGETSGKGVGTRRKKSKVDWGRRILQSDKGDGRGWLNPSKDNRKFLLHSNAATSKGLSKRFPRWMTRAPTLAMATLLPVTRAVRPTQYRARARFLSFSTKERSIHPRT